MVWSGLEMGRVSGDFLPEIRQNFQFLNLATTVNVEVPQGLWVLQTEGETCPSFRPKELPQSPGIYKKLCDKKALSIAEYKLSTLVDLCKYNIPGETKLKPHLIENMSVQYSRENPNESWSQP